MKSKHVILLNDDIVPMGPAGCDLLRTVLAGIKGGP